MRLKKLKDAIEALNSVIKTGEGNYKSSANEFLEIMQIE